MADRPNLEKEKKALIDKESVALGMFTPQAVPRTIRY